VEVFDHASTRVYPMLELESRYIASATTTQKTAHTAIIVACISHHCVATVASLAGEFIGALLVAQQREVNTRNSVVV
jgi:hypothetical protein